METFSPEFPETASAELIAVINVCQPVKKFLSFSLLKLIKRALQELDLDLLTALVQDLQIDFRQGPFKSLAIQLVVQQGMREKQRLEEDSEHVDFSGPSARQYVQFLDLLLSDARYGEMFVKHSDQHAYGNSILHVCVELHNIDFTRLVLAKNTEYGANLLNHRNSEGLTPRESLTKEIERANSGLNPAKKVRQLQILGQLRELIPEN